MSMNNYIVDVLNWRWMGDVVRANFESNNCFAGGLSSDLCNKVGILQEIIHGI